MPSVCSRRDGDGTFAFGPMMLRSYSISSSSGRPAAGPAGDTRYALQPRPTYAAPRTPTDSRRRIRVCLPAAGQRAPQYWPSLLRHVKELRYAKRHAGPSDAVLSSKHWPHRPMLQQAMLQCPRRRVMVVHPHQPPGGRVQEVLPGMAV